MSEIKLQLYIFDIVLNSSSENRSVFADINHLNLNLASEPKARTILVCGIYYTGRMLKSVRHTLQIFQF